MTAIFDAQVQATIRRLVDEALKSPRDSVTFEVAHVTAALPVLLGIGGALSLTPEGKVLSYDYEARTTTAADERATKRALLHASRRFPDLKNLAPKRPSSSEACDACNGSGILISRSECGKCAGLGWV